MSKTDYDLTNIRAVVFDIDGVLSPACVSIGDNGIPRRMTNLRDGYAIYHAIRKGLKIAIISGCNDETVLLRYNALGIKDIVLTSGEKLSYLQKWLTDNDIRKEEVAYVGDDVPDYGCMTHAGLPIAPADAAPEIQTVAKYVTKAKGGYGVAREIIEQIMKAQGIWPLETNAFGL